MICPHILLEYADGTIERIAGTDTVPPGFDSQTGFTSKDIIIIPETGVSARIYTLTTTTTNQKLPLVMYLHGGAFVIASPGQSFYHNFCNQLVGSANVMVVSVDYRLAPEHRLPAAYDDSWAAIQWVAAHVEGDGPEEWLNEGVDFKRVFLAGDSAGSTLARYVVRRASVSYLDERVGIEGMIFIHPYFWGKDRIGSEITDPRTELVDRWWLYVCPSDKGCDDPLINPFTDGAPSIDRVACDRVIVLVAENDVLRERGKYYCDAMSKGSGKGKAEYFVSEGKDHVFHIFDPDCDKAVEMRRKIASFINQERD